MIHIKEKNFGPTPDGGEILVKVQIGVAIMQKEES
jgi:hypothetical protein